MTGIEPGLLETFRNASFTSGSSFRWFSRLSLPAQSSKTDFNVWAFVKQCIGKDLTKISMPVELNEPLSFLQRVAEYMEYSELLKEAVAQNDPVRRMEYVCAFAISATASNHNRVGKPFNPLLGETYELHHNGFMLVAEQVSHHPPITAVHVESKDFCLFATVQFKLRFWGKSIEVQSKGSVKLRLLKHNELYTWQCPNLIVHNVLLGKLWLEHVGSMHVTNHTLDIACHIEFHPTSWFNALGNQITGQLIGSDRRAVRQLFGDWTRGVFSVAPRVWEQRHVKTSIESIKPPGFQCMDGSNSCESPRSSSFDATQHEADAGTQFGFDIILPEQRCLWQARPRSADAPIYYNFTQYAIGLNELNEELAEAQFVPVLSNRRFNMALSNFLPPTDSRFRPDVRALELGQLKVAASEKDRLEEKQRHATKRSCRLHCGSNKSEVDIVRSTATSPQTKRNGRSDNFHALSNTSSSQSNEWTGSRACTGPIWFTRNVNEVTGQDEWLFTGDYWARDWSKCPDLF